MTSFDEIQQLRDQYKKACRNVGEQSFFEHFKPYFEANPEITFIRWTQYTPYFNDGEPCVFDVNDPESINLSSNEEKWLYEDSVFSPLWDQIPKDVFMEVFGDHAEIMIYRDGTIEVIECCHD